MGISDGKTARVIVSAISNKIAPAKRDMGISRRLSGPVSNLIIWGTKSPTKPMIPDTDTQIAATSEAVTRRKMVTFLVSTPSDDAVRFPKDIRFISRAKNMKAKKPIKTNKKVRPTSVQVFDPKLPINQKMMTATCSSATYFRKLIPADKIAATMMPERIRLFEESPPLEDERYITNNNVTVAPTNANKGTEYDHIIPKLNKIASYAPKAAPADTPSV